MAGCRTGFAAVLIATGWVAGGCVRRTVTITTEPPGALLWLNDREIGRTPVEVDFEFYGTYDVRLERPGYEPMMTSGQANAPLWDTVGLDFLAELAPLTLRAHVKWHYVMEPLDEDRDALIDRATELRETMSSAP